MSHKRPGMDREVGSTNGADARRHGSIVSVSLDSVRLLAVICQCPQDGIGPCSFRVLRQAPAWITGRPWQQQKAGMMIAGPADSDLSSADKVANPAGFCRATPKAGKTVRGNNGP